MIGLQSNFVQDDNDQKGPGGHALTERGKSKLTIYSMCVVFLLRPTSSTFSRGAVPVGEAMTQGNEKHHRFTKTGSGTNRRQLDFKKRVFYPQANTTPSVGYQRSSACTRWRPWRAARTCSVQH